MCRGTRGRAAVAANGLVSEGASPTEARKPSLRHFAILKHSGVALIDEAIQHPLLPLGTHVLWVNDWADIPKRLRALYESTGNIWSAVS